MVCKNCGSEVNENYCPNCGQRANVGRITTANFFNDLSESVFQVNRGFFYTVVQLFVAPGESIQAFLEGKRTKFFKPIGYVLLMSTIYFLVTRYTEQETWIGDLISGFNSFNAEEEIKSPKALTWFNENFAYTNLLLLPVFSVASYLAFYKAKYNYLEHLVLNAYITGQQSLIYLSLSILFLFSDNRIVESIPPVISMLYLFWVYWSFFNKKSRALNLICTVLTYLIYGLLASLTLQLIIAFSN